MEFTSGWAFMAAVGVAAAAAAWLTVTTLVAMANPLRRRMKALAARDTIALSPGSAARGSSGPVWQLLEPEGEAERSAAYLKLARAGFQAPHALGVLYASRLGGALLTPLLAIGALQLAEVVLRTPLLVLVGIGASLVGFVTPGIVLARAAALRRSRLMQGLPDALDLLVTCTEAGLGFNAALERVVEQLPASHPELAFELGQVNAEIRAGVDRAVALRNLSERTGLEEISGLVSLISHSTRLGTGISSTLRIYADDFRDRRMQRAEELAATVGTKLMFPLLLCLFPSFFVVAVGPAILGVIQVLSQK